MGYCWKAKDGRFPFIIIPFCKRLILDLMSSEATWGSILFHERFIVWEHVLESLSHTRNEEHMDEDREDRRDPRKVLVSDCLSDPQKNSSITCGFPFLFFFKPMSARVGTAIESEKTKCLDVFTLGIAQSDCLFF